MPIKSSRVDVDIISQTLAEVIQRPRLGTLGIAEASGYLAANTENLIIGLAGAGTHFGTYFWAESSGLMDNDYLKVVADGVAIILPTFGNFNKYNFTMGSPAWAFGTLYDAINFKIAGGATYTNYTWNTSFLIYYVETHGRNPLAGIKLIYSLF